MEFSKVTIVRDLIPKKMYVQPQTLVFIKFLFYFQNKAV